MRGIHWTEHRLTQQMSGVQGVHEKGISYFNPAPKCIQPPVLGNYPSAFCLYRFAYFTEMESYYVVLCPVS